jgi:GT2 family glycosyltransferase
MKSFYECNLFVNEDFYPKATFSILQQEVLLDKVMKNGKASFSKISVEYRCFWFKQESWDSNKPTIVIPIKDNKELISTTIDNLKEKSIDLLTNIIIVDDRSQDSLSDYVIEKGLSYLRVDNPKGFNFSMLNNIAAKIAHTLGSKELIMWNSDLWCVKKQYFMEFLKRHRDSDSTISGSKLVYPPIEYSMNKQQDSDNIKYHFPQMMGGKWRETIQFGGAGWINTTGPITHSPFHRFRFKDKDNNLVNCDKGETFVTGALQIINLEWFVSQGGLNPSLSKNMQDVDLCLRAIKSKKNINYFGKDIYFYHDESVSLIKEGKVDKQMQSDHILFGKIWNNTIGHLVY